MINNIHNFHLVLNNNLKEKIVRLSKELKISKSNTIIKILTETLCILSKYQLDSQENTENMNYQKINWDSDIHIYMDKNLYRKIKHLADTVFSFSVAIVIRKLMEIYFNILEKNNGRVERVKKVLKRFYLIYVKKYEFTKKQWTKEIKNKQLLGNFYYYLGFNDKFAITGFIFNNSF